MTAAIKPIQHPRIVFIVVPPTGLVSESWLSLGCSMFEAPTATPRPSHLGIRAQAAHDTTQTRLHSSAHPASPRSSVLRRKRAPSSAKLSRNLCSGSLPGSQDSSRNDAVARSLGFFRCEP